MKKPNQTPDRVKQQAITQVPPNNEPNPQGHIDPVKQVTTFPEQAQQPSGVGTVVTPNLVKKKQKRATKESKQKNAKGKRVSKRTKK